MYRTEIEPFYFGTSSKPLFGCYHAPQAALSRGCAVIFCAPLGSEYVRFHRAYRQLADRLAKAGFPVLRFDFYGCGDSSGDDKQGRIDQWLQDIAMAFDEIRKKVMITKVCLIGLRLGAALAMMNGAERGDIDGMVLWDPVVSGKVYFEELTGLHTHMLRYAHVLPKHSSTDEQQTEILGFPFTKAMIADLNGIDMLTIQQKPAHNILIVESHKELGQVLLHKHLQTLGANVTYTQLPAPQLWVWEEAFGKIRVPHHILQSVVSWMSEVYL